MLTVRSKVHVMHRPKKARSLFFPLRRRLDGVPLRKAHQLAQIFQGHTRRLAGRAQAAVFQQIAVDRHPIGGAGCSVPVGDTPAGIRGRGARAPPGGAGEECFGGLDLAFNVAGGNRSGYIPDLDIEDWDFVVDLCLKSVFLCIKHQSRQMLSGSGGAIVNIASVSEGAADTDVQAEEGQAKEGAWELFTG